MGVVWTKSGQIEWDNNGERASGCLAYFFSGGTTTPLTVYQDGDESTPHEHPLEADANGRWPFVSIPFVATYDVKIVTEDGVQLYYHEDIPNPDPVEEAEDDVDDTQILQTGDWKFRAGTGTLSGFVRANGRTIGSASSGATERANADTEDLYEYLWDNFADTILAVTGGRGATAAADFAANKPIALFDARASGLIGLDDMGNTAASRFASATFTTGDATTGGSIVGSNTHTLTSGELASHTHTFSVTSGSGGSHTHTGAAVAVGNHTHSGTTDIQGASHTHTFSGPSTRVASAQAGAGAANLWQGTTGENTLTQNSSHTHTFTTGGGGTHSHDLSIDAGGSHTHTVSGTTASTGSGTAHNIVSRAVVGSWYLKL